MASTDSDSSGTHKNIKSSKKRKHKSERKHKKNKKEKRKKNRNHAKSGTDSSEDTRIIKRKVPKILTSSTDTPIVADSFGPALPPHLLKLQSVTTVANSMIGPVLPSNFDVVSKTKNHDLLNVNIVDTQNLDKIEDNSAELYGPVPLSDIPMSAAERELEQRALELKLAAIEGDATKTVDQKVREEWMLELPDVGLKGGLAALSNLKRTFHQGKEKPDFTDRSAWTKTPQGDNNAQMPSTSKNIVKILQEDAQANYDRLRDKEQEQIAKKHKKKHKRDESLVELHQKKLRKEQKQKEKELAAAGMKPERRPFSRDVDLKLNKIDKNQTKSIVDKAKILNTKFSSGHTKYL